MDSLARNSTLWNFIKNPGLQHLAKEIFWNLNYSSLEICQQINESSSQILENPFFWLEKFIREGSISKKNQEDWTKVIQSVINTNMEKHIVLYLKWTLKEKGAGDVTIYTNPMFKMNSMRKFIGRQGMGIQKLSRFWPLCQTIPINQKFWVVLQLMWQQEMDIQKL